MSLILLKGGGSSSEVSSVTVTALPAIVSIDGLVSSSQMISSISVAESEVLQISRAIGDAVYVYSHGGDVGRTNISGASIISSTCLDQAVDGFEEIVQFYVRNRASKSEAVNKQITVAINKQIISGYLASFSAELSQQSPRLATWNMMLLSVRKNI